MEDIRIPIPLGVRFILEKLTGAGYEAFLVGGCVRDFLLGRIPGDWDVTTNALPEEIKKVFADHSQYDLGEKFGTITVISEEHHVEITTYRIEKDYRDHRRPDSVVFTQDIIKDLERRDFTMNAMAYSPFAGFVDPFNGRDSLKRGVIDCVGEADKRFEEDPLRIMRALRFASVFSMNIEKNVEDSIKRNKDLLNYISAERIATEFKKLICGQSRKVADILREFSSVMDVRVKGVGLLAASEHFESTLDHICALPPVAEYRLGALAWGIEEAKEGEGLRFGEELKFSCKEKDFLNFILANRNIQPFKDRTEARLWLKDILPEKLEKLIYICSFSGKFTQQEWDTAKKILDELTDSGEYYTLKDIGIKGEDLVAAGFSGKEIREKLNQILEKICLGELENSKPQIIRWIEAQRVKSSCTSK